MRVMTWIWVVVTVISGTIGDVLSAKGMAIHGELQDFGPRAVGHALRYMMNHPLVLAGIASNALSFFSFIALLSFAELSFAVPVTALGYVLKAALARWYLREYVSWRRWTGAVLVTIGIVLICF
jgi:uncharacterized membrane protein